jgi:hypothetical protein
MFWDLRKRFLYKTKVTGGAFLQLFSNDEALRLGVIQANSVEVEKIIGVSENKLKPKTLSTRKLSGKLFRFIRSTYTGTGFDLTQEVRISEDFENPLWMVLVLRWKEQPAFGIIFPGFRFFATAFWIEGLEKTDEDISPWRNETWTLDTQPQQTQIGGAEIPLREDGTPESFFRVRGNFNSYDATFEYLAFYGNKP